MMKQSLQIPAHDTADMRLLRMKFCSKARNGQTAEGNFHPICIVMAKVNLVRWAPGRAGVKYVLSNTNTNTNTFFSRVSNTNTNTNTPAKIWSNTNTNTNTAHQIQIQIHNEAETKLPPFYRWHIQIHCIVRRLFCLFKFHWKLFPKVQSTVISLHWFRLWLGAE